MSNGLNGLGTLVDLLLLSRSRSWILRIPMHTVVYAIQDPGSISRGSAIFILKRPTTDAKLSPCHQKLFGGDGEKESIYHSMFTQHEIQQGYLHYLGFALI